MRATKQIIRRGLLLFTALSSVVAGVPSATAAAAAQTAGGAAAPRPAAPGPTATRPAATGPGMPRPAASRASGPSKAPPLPAVRPAGPRRPVVGLKPPPGKPGKGDVLPAIPPSPSSPPPAPGPVDGARAHSAAPPRVFRGWALDTCLAPPLDTLDAWGESHYRGIGVYFGGRGRGCPDQPNLSRDWVAGADSMGWNVLPVYVGSQAPCVNNANKRRVTIGDDPQGEGLEEGQDAVARAQDMGMAAGSALYLDMEDYDIGDGSCADTTLEYVRSWNRTVRDLGYLPGYYSSADSGVRHVAAARREGVTDLPEAIWYARWHVTPSLDREKVLPKGAWSPHRRIHQYEGNVSEEHGGVRMTIDRNKIDAPVAVVAHEPGENLGGRAARHPGRKNPKAPRNPKAPKGPKALKGPKGETEPKGHSRRKQEGPRRGLPKR